jgi:hypothetical protein
MHVKTNSVAAWQTIHPFNENFTVPLVRFFTSSGPGEPRRDGTGVASGVARGVARGWQVSCSLQRGGKPCKTSVPMKQISPKTSLRAWTSQSCLVRGEQQRQRSTFNLQRVNRNPPPSPAMACVSQPLISCVNILFENKIRSQVTHRARRSAEWLEALRTFLTCLGQTIRYTCHGKLGSLPPFCSRCSLLVAAKRVY